MMIEERERQLHFDLPHLSRQITRFSLSAVQSSVLGDSSAVRNARWSGASGE
jgi:hypothetical protein